MQGVLPPLPVPVRVPLSFAAKQPGHAPEPHRCQRSNTRPPTAWAQVWPAPRHVGCRRGPRTPRRCGLARHPVPPLMFESGPIRASQEARPWHSLSSGGSSQRIRHRVWDVPHRGLLCWGTLGRGWELSELQFVTTRTVRVQGLLKGRRICRPGSSFRATLLRRFLVCLFEVFFVVGFELAVRWCIQLDGAHV